MKSFCTTKYSLSNNRFKPVILVELEEYNFNEVGVIEIAVGRY